jgi:hypothetical protein
MSGAKLSAAWSGSISVDAGAMRVRNARIFVGRPGKARQRDLALPGIDAARARSGKVESGLPSDRATNQESRAGHATGGVST